LTSRSIFQKRYQAIKQVFHVSAGERRNAPNNLAEWREGASSERSYLTILLFQLISCHLELQDCDFRKEVVFNKRTQEKRDRS
jgi:hypothetical protein